MDCKYIKQNDIHDQYWMDRLNDPEKNDYLKHIHDCESCRGEFERQNIVISSIRNAGKREMKADISNQVQVLKARKTGIDWDMILKVAAVFFFLVITPGLVYYYQTVELPQPLELYKTEDLMGKNDSGQNLEKPLLKEKTEPGKSNISSKSDEKPQPELISGARSAKIDYRLNMPSRPVEKKVVMKKMSVEELRTETESVSGTGIAAPSPPLKFNLQIPNSTTFSSPVSIIPQNKSLNYQPQKIDANIATGGKKLTNREKRKIASYENQMEQSSSAQYIPVTRKKHEFRFENTDSQKYAYRLKYENAGKTISISIGPFFEDLETDTESDLPISFPVIIQQSDTAHLSMKWFVNSNFLNIKPEEIKINLVEDSLLYVNVPSNHFYKMSLAKDSSQAVLIK